jgi:hypothetical protein
MAARAIPQNAVFLVKARTQPLCPTFGPKGWFPVTLWQRVLLGPEVVIDIGWILTVLILRLLFCAGG